MDIFLGHNKDNFLTKKNAKTKKKKNIYEDKKKKNPL